MNSNDTTSQIPEDAQVPVEAPASEPAAEPEVDLQDQVLRLAAELENFRKRSRRELDEVRKYGIERAVLDFLPILDNMERALQHAGDASDPMTEGVRMVAKQFQDALARHGVAAIEAAGLPFDPEHHEALGQLPSADHAEGTVVQELQKGYKLHDRVIRPSRVMIAIAPA